MANTIPSASVFYDGDGTTTQYPVTFEYLDKAYVFATVDDADAEFTWVTDNTIEFTTAPAAGTQNVNIYRTTEADTMLAVFSEDTPFLPKYVDKDYTQLLHLIQEANSGSIDRDNDEAAARAAADAAEAAARAAADAAEAATRAAADTTLQANVDAEAAARSAADAALRKLIAGTSPVYAPSLTTLAALRLYEPTVDGEVVEVVSSRAYSANYGPTGGGTFVYVSQLSADDYPDDDGSIVVTSSGKVWIRKALLDSGRPCVYAEWWGADATYTTDATAAIQAAADAAVFWMTTGQLTAAYTAGGVLGSKGVLVMPRRWTLSATVTVNTGYVEIDFNNSVGLILSTGTFSAHPEDDSYTVAILCNGSLLSSATSYIAAYYHNRLAYNGTLLCGTLNSAGNPQRGGLVDNKIVGMHLYGSTETIRSAVAIVDNVSFSCLGVGFTTGDYGWGYSLVNCKYEQCYYPWRLYSAADNGEKMMFLNNMWFNNGYIGDMNTWASDLKVIGGSWDYPTVGGFLGPNSGAGSALVELSPGRVEYSPVKVPTLVDMSGTTSILHFHDAYIKFAADGTSGGVVTDGSIFKLAEDWQLNFENITMADVSYSALACQDDKITNGYRYFSKNLKTYTLNDYFINSGGVNSANVNEWTATKDSTSITVTKDVSANTLTITSSDTAVGSKYVYLFVPLARATAARKVSGLMTATKGSESVAALFGVGYLSGGTAVSYSSLIGSSVSMQSGETYPYRDYTTYTTAYAATPVQGAAFTGLYLRINCYNLLSTSTAIVIDCSKTGAITF